MALLAAYAALAVAHTFPLVRHLGTRLPGLGLGDNVAFAWNLWWMREALASGQSFLHTTALFAPVGAPMVLHTHTALAAAAGATLLRNVDVITAQNLWLLGSLALNGWTLYLLARAVTGRTFGAAVAGALFVVAPAVTTRLMGHFNLVAIWPLAVACLALLRWRRQPSWPRALLVGVAGGLLVFADYYLTVYFGLFTAAYLAVMHGRATLYLSRRLSRVAPVAMALAIVAFAAAAAIVLSSRTAIVIGPVAISLRTPTNALTAGWLLLALALVLRWSWRVNIGVTGSPSLRSYGTLLLAAGIAAVAVALPLLPALFDLLRSGGYATSAASLRSGPRGLDVGTLLLGPPFAGWLGPSVRAAYSRVAIDAMEASAWIGAGFAGLGVMAWRARRTEREAGRWLTLAGVFAIWSLGPWLIVLGHNTGLLLPQALARLVPVLNNARIPGRALLVSTLCLGVAGAIALDRLREARRWLALAVLLAVAVIESIAAPLPLVDLPSAGVYSIVAADTTTGAVLPVPFGLRDGFGERGRLEPDVLYQQTIHRHPVAGGFLARLPASIPAWYDTHEPFASLLRLSAGESAVHLPCAEAADGLRRAGIRFLVLYPEDGSPGLRAFVEQGLPLRRLGADDRRILFGVADSCPGEP